MNDDDKQSLAPTTEEPPRGGARPSMAFLAIASVASLVADLATKAWVVARFGGESDLPSRVDVISGHVTFIFAKNRGGAWGLLQNESESIRRPFFVLIAIVAVVFILSLYRKLSPRQWALKWGLPLVLGGAVGNLIDRIRYDYVVDFIDVRVTETFHWPTFNVADIAIVIGVGLMAVDMFTARPPKKLPARGALAHDTPAESGKGA